MMAGISSNSKGNSSSASGTTEVHQTSTEVHQTLNISNGNSNGQNEEKLNLNHEKLNSNKEKLNSNKRGEGQRESNHEEEGNPLNSKGGGKKKKKKKKSTPESASSLNNIQQVQQQQQETSANVWTTDINENTEREKIREFWLNLSQDDRKKLVQLEKDGTELALSFCIGIAIRPSTSPFIPAHLHYSRTQENEGTAKTNLLMSSVWKKKVCFPSLTYINQNKKRH